MDFILYFRHLAKTETMDIEMDYMSQVKLSGIGGALQQNQHRITGNSQRQDGGVVLALFSGLHNPKETLNALPSAYKLAMDLFGYSVKIEDQQVIAVCDSYEEYGMCC